MEDEDEELLRLKLAIISAPLPPPPLPPSLPTLPPQERRQPLPSSSFLYFLAHQPFPPPFLLRQFLPPLLTPHPPPPEPLLSLSLRRPSSDQAPAARRRPPTRRSPSKILLLLKRKPLAIPAPYPWATAERAKVKSIGDLLSAGIRTIKGDVKCKRCDGQYEIEYDLVEKFYQVETFLAVNEENMHNRAPPIWMSPTLANCRICKESKCVKPVVEGEKRCVNWLFLFLGQMIGCCKLTQLKYFCKHNDNHSTGAKDRVVYFTYKTLYEQLEEVKQPQT